MTLDAAIDDAAITGSATAPLVQVRDLVKDFELRRTSWRTPAGDGAGRVGRVVRHRARRGALDRGRVGLRQEHDGAVRARLIEPSSGSVRFDGVELTELSSGELRDARRRFQMVFQDPYTSLNPRMTVGEIVGEPLLVHGATAPSSASRVAELLEHVQLGNGRRRPVSAPVLRWSATTHRHRPGAGARTRPGRARRAGLGTRRQHPSRDHPAAAAASRRARAGLPVHRPRPIRRSSSQPPGCGDVPRQDRRDRSRRRAVPAARRIRTRRRCCRRRRSPIH